MRAPIGLFYGSSTCYTEMAAEKIRDRLGEECINLSNAAAIVIYEAWRQLGYINAQS